VFIISFSTIICFEFCIVVISSSAHALCSADVHTAGSLCKI
jgi:hypothetical protein